MKDMQNMRRHAAEDIKNIHYYGRNGRHGGAVAFFWTGSGFAVQSAAGELWAELEADYDTHEPWVSVWVDGCQVSRFPVPRGRGWHCLIRGLQPGAAHRVALLKETQAMSEDSAHLLLFHALAVPAAGAKNSGDPFLPLERPALAVEFIGDSLTSGEGLAGAVHEMDWIPAWLALRDNYAIVSAARLHADFHILSQSGWGVAAAWNNDRNHILPACYEQVCGLAGGRSRDCGAGEAWDFSRWQPDVVVVNLGTNDCGAFANPPFVDPHSGVEWKFHRDDHGEPVEADVQLVLRAVTDFIACIRRHNPNAHILWAYGMCSFDLGERIRAAVREHAERTQDSKLGFLALPSMAEEVDGERGSRQHPGWGTHHRAADVLVQEIRRLTAPSAT